MEQGGQTVEREKRKGPMDSSFKHFKGAWRIHLV
jgi:hypothetical protein